MTRSCLLAGKFWGRMLCFSKPRASFWSLTRVHVGDEQAFTRHTASLMYKQVRPLVVRVVGDEQTGGRGVMRVEGFDDLCCLRCQITQGQCQLSSPWIQVPHTCLDTDSQFVNTPDISTHNVMRLHIHQKGRDHGYCFLSAQVALRFQQASSKKQFRHTTSVSPTRNR